MENLLFLGVPILKHIRVLPYAELQVTSKGKLYQPKCVGGRNAHGNKVFIR